MPLADKGYHNAAEMQQERELGYITFVVERKHASSKKEGDFPPGDFCYDEGLDAYICLVGNLLQSTGRLYIRKGTDHRFQTYRASRKDCRCCLLREHCLTTTGLAQSAACSITRLEHAAAVEANHDNLYQNPEVYPQR